MPFIIGDFLQKAGESLGIMWNMSQPLWQRSFLVGKLRRWDIRMDVKSFVPRAFRLGQQSYPEAQMEWVVATW